MLMWAFLVVLAGSGIAVQLPIIAIAAQRVGLIRNLFLVNATGLLTAALLLPRIGPQGAPFSAPPWYAYLAGPMGIGIMAALSYAIPRLGISSTLVLSITAQIVVGFALEQSRFLGLVGEGLSWTRLAGAAVMVVGAWLVVRP
jgi:transporter family-2 protein